MSKVSLIENNADWGISLQADICSHFKIPIPEEAKNQFSANYNRDYFSRNENLINKIFQEIGLRPIKCLTYTKDEHTNKLSPHNFVLENGQTLSIHTNKKGDKVAPPIVGQPGYQKFNEHFGHLDSNYIETQNDIKKLVLSHIAEMMPIFIDYLFSSDYTVWIYNENDIDKYLIFNTNHICTLDDDPENYSFTKSTLSSWNESTTLKYLGKSIAEIQVHKNRTFKCRIIMKNLLFFIKKQIETTETLGITAEKAICELCKLNIPTHYLDRYSPAIQKNLEPAVKEAFNHLPAAIRSTGTTSGTRGKQSKCSYDFELSGSKTLSVKTNKSGHMICPPEVGQPGAETCWLYFGDLVENKTIQVMTETEFKKLVMSKIDEMLPIYLEHLFDSDYLLWIFKNKKSTEYQYKIFEKNFVKNFVWDKNLITYTKNLDNWNESNTIKYDGIRIGEFQVHRARSCFKFRFDMLHLEQVIKRYTKPGSN